MTDYNSIYSGAQIDEAVGRALGFGLGASAAYLEGVDLNTLHENGWYRLSSTCTNAPTAADGIAVGGGAILEVVTGGSGYFAEQTYHLGTAGQQGGKLRRYYDNATRTWQPWEWVNPPMELGVEYRTTERLFDKPVYTKMLGFGKMPNASLKSVAHGAENVNYIFVDLGKSAARTAAGQNLLPLNTNITGIDVGSGKVNVRTAIDLSAYDMYLCLKYTKTTN